LLLQLGVLVLSFDQVQDDGEYTCENKGQEERESGQIYVPLRVEFLGCVVGLRTNIRHTLTTALCHFRLCSGTEHALESVQEENGYEDETYFQAVCDLGDNWRLREEAEKSLLDSKRKWEDQYAECDHFCGHQEKRQGVVDCHLCRIRWRIFVAVSDNETKIMREEQESLRRRGTFGQ